MAICSMARQGHGIIMLTQQHRGIVPILGFETVSQVNYQTLYNLLDSSLKGIVFNEEYIKVEVTEVPIFSAAEIGKPKTQE